MIKKHQELPENAVKWQMYKKIMDIKQENCNDLCFLLSEKDGSFETMSVAYNKRKIAPYLLNTAIAIHSLHYNVNETKSIIFYIKILVIKYFNIKKQNIKIIVSSYFK